MENYWRCMMNKKGIGAWELLTIAVMCFIIAAFILTLTLKNAKKEQFKVMTYNAKLFGQSAINLEDGENKVYLVQLVDNGLSAKVKNPFEGEKYCDMYNSKVEIANNTKYVTLKCGDYYIYHHDINDDKYTIYKSNGWQDKKISNNDLRMMGYNYVLNNKEAFNEYYEKEAFLYAFNKSNNTNYEDLNQIPNTYKINNKELFMNIALEKTNFS
jgi:hypothetical protein